MRFKLKLSLLVVGSLTGAHIGVQPAGAQSLSQGLSQGQQPSEQQIEAFCANWGQLSGSQRKQYQAQYDEYCDRPSLQPETTIIEPEQPQQQQPEPEQPSQKPQKPDKPEKPAEPEAPEPQIERARPEPAIPEPAPRRVDLVGELALAGPLAREPGERQRLRVTVENRGSDTPRGNRLWARVFLSDREVSRRGASAGGFAFSGARQGRPVRLPGVPNPGRSREVTTEITLPAGRPDGSYWWCVRVDTRQQIEETNEGNNVACARKVVALGGESDSELSDVFGSKVAELNQQEDRTGRRASQWTHPGLLQRRELDRMADLLMRTGGMSYDVRTGRIGDGISGERKRGLLLMRNPDDLVPLEGDYYGDGRGNLILFGTFSGPESEGMPYALTLFGGGGLQLVVDSNRDGIIDVGVSEGLEERFGFLASPDMRHALECMQRAVERGGSAARGLRACVGGDGSDGDGDAGGHGGSGGEVGSDLESALEPDCESDQGGVGTSGGLAQSGGDEEWDEEKELRDAADAHRKNEAHHRRQTERHRESDRSRARRHQSEADEEQRLARMADEAADNYEFARRVSNDDSSSDSEYTDAITIAIKSRNKYERARDNRSPAPGPGGIPGSGNSDPRCEEPTIWNRLATEECANDMAHCINKLTDPLYNATGGQCRTARGPADNTTIQCDDNDGFRECVEGGDDVRSCAEKHAGDDGGGVTPSPNDDITPDDQGTLEYGLMDVQPFGATLAAMCREAGGIGPCGDPSPAMDEAR